MISLTQLEYIVAIDNYKHFGKAADACHVTQPTLSMQIKKLEEDIGTQIFDRQRQPIITTPAGEALITQARAILRATKQFEELAAHYAQHIVGNFRIGIIPTVAPYLLPYFIGSFQKKYDNVKLKIIEMKTEDIIKNLQLDEIDAGILATPLHEPEIIEEPLFFEEIMVYAKKNHPLIQKQILQYNDIMREDIWMLTQGNCFRDQVVNICSIYDNFEEKTTYESTSIETLKKMVDIEGGFTLIPELAVLELSTKKLENIATFKQPKPLREISLVYIRNIGKRKILDAIKSEIINNIPDTLLQKNKGKIVEWK
ncbi:MAG: hydrogen peroxide-inducible genes activator [Sphingobacteriales bacterium]|jgi:LysR family hydrogen peroxide-inducible transcriptional activator|nr:MAG: hydrogen peroxide-inducible genes activator [Sphingobacteriales bacterium]